MATIVRFAPKMKLEVEASFVMNTPQVGDVFEVVELITLYGVPSAVVKLEQGGFFDIPLIYIPDALNSLSRKFKIVDEKSRMVQRDGEVRVYRKPIIEFFD